MDGVLINQNPYGYRLIDTDIRLSLVKGCANECTFISKDFNRLAFIALTT